MWFRAVGLPRQTLAAQQADAGILAGGGPDDLLGAVGRTVRVDQDLQLVGRVGLLRQAGQLGGQQAAALWAGMHTLTIGS